MAAGTKPIFEQVPALGLVQIAPADTTTKKTLVTGATEGTRVDAISVCSNDTAAVTLMFYVTVSGVDYFLGAVGVPIGSGYTTVPKIAAMATLAPDLGYLWIPSGAVLKVAALATVTAAKVVDVVATAGDY
jgi:hypothetical protein